MSNRSIQENDNTLTAEEQAKALATVDGLFDSTLITQEIKHGQHNAIPVRLESLKGNVKKCLVVQGGEFAKKRGGGGVGREGWDNEGCWRVRIHRVRRGRFTDDAYYDVGDDGETNIIKDQSYIQK